MWKSIVITTLIAGTLDIVAACLHAYWTAKIMPERVLKYIASGLFGKSAFASGPPMIFLGLLIHFCITFACAFVFYWIYPKWALLKFSFFINALFIGIVAWLVTTQLLIPLSPITTPPFNLLKAVWAICILIVCIGLPIAFRAQQFYKL